MSMQETLFQKIAGLNPAEPYIWRLALSAAEFEILQEAICRQVKLSGGAAVLEKEWAMRTIAYIAEWYKRCYDAGNSKPTIELNSRDLQTLWKNSGLDQTRFLYTFANGDHSWLYSIYVLGGLAIKLELGKKDTRYLKELCKLYHGDSDKLDNLDDDAARAAAFRKSISDQGSLYNYFRVILNGDLPFAKEELNDKNSSVNLFIERIKNANDEVLKSKFRIEWLINFSPTAPYLMRRLRFWLKPEKIGGIMHQYLRFERVYLWGIKEPEKLQRLRLTARFKEGEKIIAPADADNPLITFTRTGNSETGFTCWGDNRYIEIPHVPVENFSAVEIIAFDDNNKAFAVEEFSVPQWLQLFRIKPYEDKWSSIPQSQHETALLCSDQCKLLEVKENESIYQLPFYDKKYGTGTSWYWRTIHDFVTFSDEKNKEITLYNRQGYDRITTVLHSDVLRYSDSGMVKLYIWNDEIEDCEETLIPLLLSKDDLLIRHFDTKDAIVNVKYDQEAKPESVKFHCKKEYCLWNEENTPQEGLVKLRIQIKDREYPYSAYYLPLDIIRDFNNCQIHIGKEILQDEFPDGTVPSQPVKEYKRKNGNDCLLLEIWRPFLRRELICNDKLIRSIAPAQRFAIPYILKDDWVIQDFSAAGYQKYFCRNIGNIYAIKNFSSEGSAHEDALKNNRQLAARDLDYLAPEGLDVCFAVPIDSSMAKDEIFYRWNFVNDPKQVSSDEVPGKNEIIFHDANNSPASNKFISKTGPFTPFGYPKNIDLVKCFEIAAQYKLYFFEILPFKKNNERESWQEFYEQLSVKRNGVLTESDKTQLQRLAAEFSFDWKQDYNINI